MLRIALFDRDYPRASGATPWVVTSQDVTSRCGGGWQLCKVADASLHSFSPAVPCRSSYLGASLVLAASTPPQLPQLVPPPFLSSWVVHRATLVSLLAPSSRSGRRKATSSSNAFFCPGKSAHGQFFKWCPGQMFPLATP